MPVQGESPTQARSSYQSSGDMQSASSGCFMNNHILPNLIIAGVTKAGTTSIFTYLSLHTDICASRIKETCFFLPLRYGRPIRRLSEYEKYFVHCGAQKFIMESTPGYFYGGRALAEAIRHFLDDIRIVIVFRDPVDRSFSFYKSQKSKFKLNKNITFGHYIRQCEGLGRNKVLRQEFNEYSGIIGGFYADYLDPWLETFSPSHVKILFFDDLRSNPRRVLKGLCRWLEIDSGLYDKMSFSIDNKSVDYKNRMLHRMARGLNDRIEEFSRRYPFVKQRARDIYFKLNVREFEESMSEEERIYLAGLYQESNRALRLKLKTTGCRHLPVWLKGV
jgi:hypothetical protein